MLIRSKYGLWIATLLGAWACSGKSEDGGRDASGGSPASGGRVGDGGRAATGASGGAGAHSSGGSAPSGGTSAGGAISDGTGGVWMGGNGGIGGTPDACTFQIVGELSPVIPTVGIVHWSTDLPGVTEARIEFTLDDPQEGELNLGSGGPLSLIESRSLLLGLKPERSYTYRIVASAGGTECVSPDQTIVTGRYDAPVPVGATLGEAATQRAAGFVVACGYTFAQTVIIDTDGAVVWQVDNDNQCSRAHMDWSGQYLWTMRANAAVGASAGGTMGRVTRIRMDGTELEELDGLARAHHDFAVAPGGVAAFLVVEDEGGQTEIVERAADGAMTTLVRLDESGYGSASSQYHPNALRYDPRDDTYTVSDLSISAIAKFDRQGTRQWLMSGAELLGTHGHHLLDDGNVLSFSANIGGGSTPTPSPVFELRRDPDGGPPSIEWEYVQQYKSLTFGDVQRLPNGNTLITYSNDGVLVEVTPDQAIAQTLEYQGRQVAYTTFRETLYGPPPR